MDMNLYALEKQVQSKLQDARAAGARAGLISSLRRDRSGGSSVLAAIATMWESRHRLLRRVSAGASGA